MKDLFFSFFWAAICAWIATWLLIKADMKWGLSSEWVFPTIIDFLCQYNIPVKKFTFCTLTLLFLITGLHKLIGNGIRILIGIVGFILFVSVVVFGVFLFLSWLAAVL